MRETLNILHVSDLHAREDLREQIEMRTKALFADVERMGTNIDIAVFSGDLAYSGKPQEYQLAVSLLLDPLSKRLKIPRKHVIIVPGNHDVDRSLIDPLIEAGLRSKLNDTMTAESYLEDSEHSQKRLTNYYEFRAGYGGNPRTFFSTYTDTINGVKVGIALLNTAWRCSEDDKGQLFLTEKQVNAAVKELQGCQLRIAALHHPLSCLHESESKVVIPDLKRQFDLVLTGHAHEADTRGEQTPGNGCLVFTSPSICDNRDFAGYNLYTVDYVASNVLARYRKFVRTRREFDMDTDYATGGEAKFTLQVNDMVLYNKGVLAQRASALTKDLSNKVQEHLHSLQQIPDPCLVRPALYRVSRTEEQPSSTTAVDDMTSIKDPFTIVFGDPEIGKSVFLQTMAAEINKDLDDPDRGRLALYLDMGHRRDANIKKAIEQVIAEVVPNTSEAARPRDIVVLVDHVDDRTDEVIQALRRFQTASSDLSIIVALSNRFVFDTMLARKDMEEVGFYELGCWGPSRIREITRHFFSDGTRDPNAAAEFVLHSLQETDLPATPVIVVMYLTVFRDSDNQLNSLSFLELLERFEEIRLASTDSSPSGALYNKQRILTLIAAQCARDGGISLPRKQAEDVIEQYFEDKYLTVGVSRFIADLGTAGLVEVTSDKVGFRYYVLYDYYLARAIGTSLVDLAASTNSLHETVRIANALALYAGMKREEASLAAKLLDQIAASYDLEDERDLAALDKLISEPLLGHSEEESADDIVAADLAIQPDYEMLDEPFKVIKNMYSSDREKTAQYQAPSSKQEELDCYMRGLKAFYNIFRNLENIKGHDKVALLDRALDYHIQWNLSLVRYLQEVVEDADSRTLLTYLFTLGGQTFLTANVGNESLQRTIKEELRVNNNDYKELLLVLLYTDLRLPGYENMLRGLAEKTQSRAASEMIYLHARYLLVCYEKAKAPAALIAAFMAAFEARHRLNEGRVHLGLLNRMAQAAMKDADKERLRALMAKQ